MERAEIEIDNYLISNNHHSEEEEEESVRLEEDSKIENTEIDIQDIEILDEEFQTEQYQPEMDNEVVVLMDEVSDETKVEDVEE